MLVSCLFSFLSTFCLGPMGLLPKKDGPADGVGQTASPTRSGQWPSPHRDEILNTIAATDSGTETVSGADEGSIKLCSWEARKQGVVQEWKQPCSVTRLAHAKVGVKELFISGGRDGGVRVWRRDQPSPLQTMKGHELTVNGVAVCPEDPTRVCSGSRDWTVRVWDADTGSEVSMVKVEWNVVSFMKWIPGGDCVLQASEDLQLRVWDVRSMARPAEVIKAAHNNVMTCCDVAPDTLTFLSSSNGFDGAGCELKVWDRRMGKMLCDLRGHTQTVSSCAYLPSAASAQPSAMPLVVSASSDTTMRTWDPSQARLLKSISVDSPANRVTSLCVCPGPEARLATASFSGALCSFSVGKGGTLSLASESSDGPSIIIGVSSHFTPNDQDYNV